MYSSVNFYLLNLPSYILALIILAILAATLPCGSFCISRLSPYAGLLYMNFLLRITKNLANYDLTPSPASCKASNILFSKFSPIRYEISYENDTVSTSAYVRFRFKLRTADLAIRNLSSADYTYLRVLATAFAY